MDLLLVVSPERTVQSFKSDTMRNRGRGSTLISTGAIPPPASIHVSDAGRWHSLTFCACFSVRMHITKRKKSFYQVLAAMLHTSCVCCRDQCSQSSHSFSSMWVLSLGHQGSNSKEVFDTVAWIQNSILTAYCNTICKTSGLCRCTSLSGSCE